MACRWQTIMVAGPRCLACSAPQPPAKRGKLRRPLPRQRNRLSTTMRRARLRQFTTTVRRCRLPISPTVGFRDKSGGLNPESKTFSIRCSAAKRSSGTSGTGLKSNTDGIAKTTLLGALFKHRIFDRTTDNQYIVNEDAFEWDDDKAAANWRESEDEKPPAAPDLRIVTL
jgi:hypothetical protein